VTQHLVFVHRDAVVHVSDRLVTDARSGAPFDHLANKAVLLEADDAFVSIGYTGIAYLEDRPTDQWIAGVVWGQPLMNSGFSIGGARQLGDVGLLVRHVVEQLARVARIDAQLRSVGITILGAGYQWKRKARRVRPVAFKIVCGNGAVRVFRIPRRWDPPDAFRLIAAPAIDPERRQRYEASLTGLLDKEHVMRALSEAIRDIADAQSMVGHPTVGYHCMAVFIPRDSGRPVLTRFIPDPRRPCSPGAGAELSGIPAAFSPYVVRSGLLAHPTEMAGHRLVEGSSRFAVEMQGADLPSGRASGALKSVRRPPRPTGRRT
jgi:hypothetical protein